MKRLVDLGLGMARVSRVQKVGQLTLVDPGDEERTTVAVSLDIDEQGARELIEALQIVFNIQPQRLS